MLRRRPKVDDRRRDIGFICDFHSPNLKFICRTGFTGRAPEADYPLANRFDEVDTLVIFDNVPIPWENGLCGAVQGEEVARKISMTKRRELLMTKIGGGRGWGV